MTPESRSQSRVGLGLRQRQPGLPALTHWQPESQPRSWTARSLFRVPGPGVAASHWQSLALAVTGPGDSPAPAESPTRRLDSFQFSSFQVRSLSLSSLARPAACQAGGPAVEEPGRPFKLPAGGPVGAAEPSARRTRSSGSSLSSLSRTQASVPSLRARRARRALRLGTEA